MKSEEISWILDGLYVHWLPQFLGPQFDISVVRIKWIKTG